MNTLSHGDQAQIVALRYRATALSMYGMLVDYQILQCELAVDAAFARANYAPSEVQRP